MDMESVRREALKRQLANMLGRLDNQRDAALTHDMLRLSSAMIGYVSQHMRALNMPDEEAQQRLMDVQLELAQAACDLYQGHKALLDEQEQQVAEEAQRSTASLNRQRSELRRAFDDVQKLHRTLMYTEMEARQTALQREAMRSRATLREE